MQWYDDIQAKRRDGVSYSDMGELVLPFAFDTLAPAISQHLQEKLFVYPIKSIPLPGGRYAFLIEPVEVENPSIFRDADGNIVVAENLGHTTPAAYGIVWLRKHSAQQSRVSVTAPPLLNSDASPWTDDEAAYYKMVEANQERIETFYALEEAVINGYRLTEEEARFCEEIRQLLDGWRRIMARKERAALAAQQHRQETQDRILDYCFAQIAADLGTQPEDTSTKSARKRGGRKTETPEKQRTYVDEWYRVQSHTRQEEYCKSVGISVSTLQRLIKKHERGEL